MLVVTRQLPVFSSEVQALTWGDLDVIPSSLFDELRLLPLYVPIADFTKSAWVLFIYLSYFFYYSTHRIEIRCPLCCFIHAIFLEQQFDIVRIESLKIRQM